MALMAKDSPLIAGSTFQEVNMGLKSVKAIRAFYSKGKTVQVGEIVSVPSLFASELISSNKAEAVIVEVPPKEDAVTFDKHREELMDNTAVADELNKIEKPKWKGGKSYVR